jgi:hypothetical protein
MTEQERAELLLRKHTGLFFCASCIASELGLAALHGRTLLWKLQALPGYEMRGTRCVHCSRGKRALRHVGTTGVVGTTAEVVVFLLANKGIYLCDACLAFTVETSLSAVLGSVASVEGLEEFDRYEGPCSVCARVKTVTAALDISSHDSDAKDDLTVRMLTGTVQYKEWRLDMLSYPIAAGWRPFVLIKGPLDARVPDAPSLLSSTFPSKGAADDHALKAAMDWIDKRYSE